ncbi:MAG: hypothetical protein WC333_02075 [Dehalococcoidia bacterium]
MIARENEELKNCGVARRYRFYSNADIRAEYEYYLKGDGNYPPHLFPPHKINTFEDFRKYWSPEALGEVFVPKNGTLNLDCYFGRTSKRAMHNIARYLLCNSSKIKSVNGSFSTFVERCGYGKKNQAILMELDK